jgi:subfamily B ATP-binding cassette protein MsbA
MSMMNSKDLYLRLLRYTRPHARIFIISLIGTLLLASTEPLVAALLKPLFDGSFVAKDPHFIVLMPLLLAAVFVLRGIAGFISAFAMNWVAQRVVMELRNEMFGKLLDLPTQRYDDFSAGALLSKLTYDAKQVMSASTDALVTLVRDSLSVTGLLIWMFYLNWKLSLIALLIAPSIALVVKLISYRLRRLSRELQETMGELTHVIDEVIQGHKVVKIFNGEIYERERFNKVNNKVRQYHMKLTAASEASVPIVEFLAVIALGIVVYIAALQSAADEITLGGFVSLFGAMGLMLSPIKRLTKVNEQLQRGLAAAESVFALIDEPQEPDNGVRPIGRVKGRVSFQNVSFRYRSNIGQVLQGVSLEVGAGETIALVGPSGGGKTSLVNLLPRFYDPGGGRILLDGIDITALRLADLRANIAYVGQDIVLFNDTVAANIAYGSSHRVSETVILAAAEGAYAMEFIRELPAGLNTLIGENGARLSTGQRQRIAIARALLKDAPILILDEATSALDSHSERQVQQALESLRHGRTAFIIAHRLSTIENADRIVVLQRGKIVEMGTHTDLLEENGLYASLYRMQFENSA